MGVAETLSPLLLFLGWVGAGILYDPIVAPRAKNGAPHTFNRWFAMWAYCRVLEAWIWCSRSLGKPWIDGKTTGEVLAALFVIQSRIWLRRIVCSFLPPEPPRRGPAAS